ncbi:hypothetical protein GCM10023229_03460 [Flavisolibacter ginsenosidimutans]
MKFARVTREKPNETVLIDQFGLFIYPDVNPVASTTSGERFADIYPYKQRDEIARRKIVTVLFMDWTCLPFFERI